MKKNNPSQVTEHHIIPKSRLRGKGILDVCTVSRRQHELYHHLFGNMIPSEILEHLNKIFWNGNYEITITKTPR